jgi:hypothetical protein
MPTSQDPYSTVAKQEAKQDADTGRRVKKWGHRAEGLVAGTILGAAAHKYGPGLLKRTKLEDMQPVHQFSRRDPLPDMGNEYLNQVLRHNQQDSCYTPVQYVQTEVVEDLIMRPLNATHNFDENDGITAGYPQPVPDCPDNGKIRSPEELYQKKWNAGQTKPQTPLATEGRPLAQIVRLAAQRRVTQFIAGYEFAEDANLRAHSPSGQFANVAQDQSAQIRKAYSPHQRVTGISPFKKKIMAAGKAALMR